MDRGLNASVMPARSQRIRRPDPPNRAAHLEHINALQGNIDSLQLRITEIKSILQNRAQNRPMSSSEFIAARKKLSDLNAAFKEAVDRRRKHREELELLKEKLRASGSKFGLPTVSVEELNEQIQKLECRQTHTTLPIDEEKRLIVQIERLKKSRDSLRRHDFQTEQDQGARAELIDLIKKDDQELNNLKTQQERQRLILANIREKESAIALDIPTLQQERNEAYEQIKGIRDTIRQHKADFSAQEEEYWKREKEWLAQQALERRIKAEKSRAEWLERERIRKEKALENYVEPYTNEIIMCEQLLSYMQKNVPLGEDAHIQQQKQKSELPAPEGFGVTLIGKKNRIEDELDGWFAGSGAKKGKKVKGSAAQKNKLREKISLSIDALSSFGKLGISPPGTYRDVGKCIEDLKAKKSQFLEMQKAERELRERGMDGGINAAGTVDVAVSEQSTEETSSIEFSAPIMDGGSFAEHNDSTVDADDGRFSMGNVEHHDDIQRENASNCTTNVDYKEDTFDSKDNAHMNDETHLAHIDDEAQLETFEFSEAHLHTEGDARIEEQAAGNGVASVIFDCSQSDSFREFSNGNSKIEEPVAQYYDNNVYPCPSEFVAVKINSATLDEQLGTSKDFLGDKVESGIKNSFNGASQVEQTSNNMEALECTNLPIVKEMVMMISAEGKPAIE
ncbi:hypothetical protein KP509_36G003600 [Ceratopteris richardii]|uniref:Uncharacterized protein n=1 Tax=Ceratopteris richardii TaxID=49495 RepID=A0A8T2QA15_CERRI|nr:hypothetical protein KP509_36G003600 [Ceratopteris richardii]